jgi:L-2-hydroxyglutarate oxidase
VTAVRETTTSVTLQTDQGPIEARRVVFCAGLQADRVARMAGLDPEVRIVPFRGEYYDVVPEKVDLVKTLIYPIPDPALPFLGVHLTPTVTGGLNVGPNAVLGLAREGYRKGSVNWADVRDLATYGGMWRVARSNVRVGSRELKNSLWKRGYLKECRKYCPELTLADLTPREAGIRAQAVRPDGSFVHDFLLRRTDRTLHVLNAPSPAATSALPIAAHLVSTLVATP